MSAAPNPYAPPETLVADPADAGPAPLASRWRRLGAAFIDTALLFAVYIAIAVVALALFGVDLMGIEDEDVSLSAELWGPDPLTEALWFGPYLLIQGPLLWLRGQTIGKLLLGTRIVGADDRKAPFRRIFFLRDLPFAIAACWPGVGMIAAALDVLLIFRKDRRCLHDHMAGTRVVLARH